MLNEVVRRTGPRATALCLALAIQEPAAVVDVDQALRAFAESWTAAVRSGGVEGRVPLLHRASIDCSADPERVHLRWTHLSLTRTLAPGPTALTLVRLEGAKARSQRGVAPVYLLTIAAVGENVTSQVSLIVGRDGERGWREVVECPGPDEVRLAAGKLRARKPSEELVKALSVDSRAELMSLLRDGRRVDAVRRCAALLRVDLTTAHDALDMLAPPARR